MVQWGSEYRKPKHSGDLNNQLGYSNGPNLLNEWSIIQVIGCVTNGLNTELKVSIQMVTVCIKVVQFKNRNVLDSDDH